MEGHTNKSPARSKFVFGSNSRSSYNDITVSSSESDSAGNIPVPLVTSMHYLLKSLIDGVWTTIFELYEDATC